MIAIGKLDRVTSATAVMTRLGSETYNRSADAQEQGTTLLLTAPDDQLAWATYTLHPFERIELKTIGVALDEAQTSEAWVALANFTHSRWDMFGPYFTDAEVDITETAEQYLSSLGNMYVSVVAHASETVAVERVDLQLENFMRTWGTEGDENGSGVAIDPVTGDLYVGGANYTDNFGLVLKYSATGEFQWVRAYTAATDSWIHDIVWTEDGPVMLGSIRKADGNSVDGFLCLLDSSGNIVWSKTYLQPDAWSALTHLSGAGDVVYCCGTGVNTVEPASSLVAAISASDGALAWGNLYRDDYLPGTIYQATELDVVVDGVVVSNIGVGTIGTCVFKVGLDGGVLWGNSIQPNQGTINEIIGRSDGIWVPVTSMPTLTLLQFDPITGSLLSNRVYSNSEIPFRAVPWAESEFAMFGYTTGGGALMASLSLEGSQQLEVSSLAEQAPFLSQVWEAAAVDSSALIGVGIANNALATGWTVPTSVGYVVRDDLIEADPQIAAIPWTPVATDVTLNVTTPEGVQDAGNPTGEGSDVAIWRYQR